MKKFKKWLTSPKATIILFVLSAALLLFTTVGAVLAALRYRSATYGARIEQCCIGVSLLEQCQNDKKAQVVASRDHAHRKDKKNPGDKWNGTEVGVLLGSGEGGSAQRFLGEDTAIIPGKTYPEAISVRNSGEIDEYVRVTIYRYWTNPKGEKVFTSNQTGTSTQGLSPDLIKLNWVNRDVWLLDEHASTEERMVFYYRNLVKSNKEEDEKKDTKPLCDSLRIDPSVADKVKQTDTKIEITDEDGNKTKKTVKKATTYVYDGWQFCVEAQVDAVQNHNIVDAAKSAWGVDLTVDDKGQISLKN